MTSDHTHTGDHQAGERLQVAVYGLWHLGCVTAAMLAEEGFQVYGLDPDRDVVSSLKEGKPPIFEPGLSELVAEGLSTGRLRFTDDREEALSRADLVWVAFDTPVDDEDRADVAYLDEQLDAALPHIKSGAVVIISSQVPVGFTERLQERFSERASDKDLVFCYSPENLRLGKALKSFRADDRIVVGLDDERGRKLIESVLQRFCSRLEWMSVKSAEMTKHALNSFLAVSVAMINEIARICERTGADAKQVERGLKSESRIGPGAYLGPGGPFAGGTLARDLRFLVSLGREHDLKTPLLEGALASNDIHKDWLSERAEGLLKGAARPARVTILGLTYKAGTDTIRRSQALSLGLRLAEIGAEITFHDPVVRELPEETASKFKLTGDLGDALRGSDLLIVSTAWPAYREQITGEMLLGLMRRAVVLDQNRFLANQIEPAAGVTYVAVGKPESKTK